MKIIYILVLLLMPSIAMADPQTEAVCGTLTKYKKVNDAAYRPDADVNGNAVVPADIDADNVVIENVTKVPITVDLANRIARLRDKGVEMDAAVGSITIYPDGRLKMGEQDVTKEIRLMCGQSQILEETQTPQEQQHQETPDQIMRAQEPAGDSAAQATEKKPKIVTDRPDLLPETFQGEGGS